MEKASLNATCHGTSHMKKCYLIFKGSVNSFSAQRLLLLHAHLVLCALLLALP